MVRNAPGRIPPGQTVTEKWPVLHYGGIPRFDPATWDLRVFGLVDHPLRFTYEEWRALPTTVVTCDIHCVTSWSRLGTLFEGVPTRTVLEMAKVRPEAAFAVAHADGGYETNMPLEYLLDEDALFAHRADGKDLTPEHGWPLRLVVPRLYFWKSAKWVRAIEILAHDRPGFWERNGYHMRGDPWKEERYSSW
jgi:DMSO/TMAO reductase YedYZ molybdopterin-dependent catalytic subunit